MIGSEGRERGGHCELTSKAILLESWSTHRTRTSVFDHVDRYMNTTIDHQNNANIESCVNDKENPMIVLMCSIIKLKNR
jgi:hypothetical protein